MGTRYTLETLCRAHARSCVWLAASALLMLQACRDEGSRRGDESPDGAAGGSDGGASASDASEGSTPPEAGLADASTLDAADDEPVDPEEDAEVAEMDARSDADRAETGTLDARAFMPEAATDPADARADGMSPQPPGLVVLLEAAARTTSESGRTFSFQVALRTAPTARVIVPVVVSEEREGLASPSVLTFTTSDWSAPKLVTIAGLNDAPPVKDGPVEYEVELGPTRSTDSRYNGLRSEPIEATNEDDDTQGVRVTRQPATGSDLLETSESGGGARISFGLTTRPTAPVTIPVRSSDRGEGLVNVSSLTIEPDAWNGLHTITVTGVDDRPPVADGTASYQVELGPTDSLDRNYDGLELASVPVLNLDNDSPALLVTAQQTPLRTTELGTTLLWVEARLLTQPRAAVRVPVASSRPGEATTDISSLTFEPSNWSAAQRIFVRGVPDDTQDGLQLYDVVFGPSESSDARYVGLTSTVPGTNYDVDTPDVLVTYRGELRTSERGDTVTLTVQLTKPPIADVTVPLAIVPASGSTRTEGEITSVSPLLFTATNYNAARSVEIRGVDDALIDGDQPYFLRVGPTESADPAYRGRELPNLALINGDDDSAGLVVVPISPVDGRLVLRESDVTPAEFTVRLQTQPSAPVQITFTSSDLSEGTPPAPLRFVPSGPGAGEFLWSEEQRVRISSVNDDVQDGPVDFQVRVAAQSSDPDYNTAALDRWVTVRTFDDGDSAGLLLGPGALPPALLTVIEPAGTTPFTVRLSSMPTAPVTIPIVTSNASEGLVRESGMSLPGGAITIQPAQWNVPRSLSLTAVRDDVDDGDQTYQVVLGPTTSLDRLYQNKSAAIEALTVDGDTANIVFDGPPLPTPYQVTTRELTPREAPPIALRLTSRPTAPVTIAVSIGGPDGDEATVSPATLTFTPSDWNDPAAHRILVTGVDDAIDDGDREYTVLFAAAQSLDPNYAGKTPSPSSLRAINSDDADTRGVVVGGGPIALFEEGSERTIELTLRSQPLQPVTIDLRLTEGGDGAADPQAATLRFGDAIDRSAVQVVIEPATWSAPRRVTVKGASDSVRLGNRPIAVELDVTSADESYDGFALAELAGTVLDIPRSCKSALELWPLTATGTGEYEIDTDLDPTTPWHFAHCDMETDGGGWTLLSYSGNTATYGGVPYPGQTSGSVPYCLAGAGSSTCSRGSGLPREDLPGLLAASTEFAQARQAPSSPQHDPYAPRIVDYASAGRFLYGAIVADLELEYGPGTCEPLATGTYFDLVGTAELDGTTVYLAQGLRSSIASNYGSVNNSYAFSLGTSGAGCTLSAVGPASYLGTWQAAQVGPVITSAVGSYAVWVR